MPLFTKRLCGLCAIVFAAVYIGKILMIPPNDNSIWFSVFNSVWRDVQGYPVTLISNKIRECITLDIRATLYNGTEAVVATTIDHSVWDIVWTCLDEKIYEQRYDT